MQSPAGPLDTSSGPSIAGPNQGDASFRRQDSVASVPDQVEAKHAHSTTVACPTEKPHRLSARPPLFHGVADAAKPKVKTKLTFAAKKQIREPEETLLRHAPAPASPLGLLSVVVAPQPWPSTTTVPHPPPFPTMAAPLFGAVATSPAPFPRLGASAKRRRDSSKTATVDKVEAAATTIPAKRAKKNAVEKEYELPISIAKRGTKRRNSKRDAMQDPKRGAAEDDATTTGITTPLVASGSLAKGEGTFGIKATAENQQGESVGNIVLWLSGTYKDANADAHPIVCLWTYLLRHRFMQHFSRSKRGSAAQRCESK